MAKVTVERSGGQVRLRGIKVSVPVSVDIKGKGVIKVVLRPNQWTSVPDEIYELLKSKFDRPRYSEVPDVDENEKNPHAPGQQGATTTEEVDPGFFLEMRR